MVKNTSIYPWIILLLLCACEHPAVYQNTIPLPENQWHVNYLPEFQFQIKEEKCAYDIYLIVEGKADYPYQNIYLTYYIEEDNQASLASDLKEYELFDLKTGKSLGNGFGKTKHHAFLMLDNYCFPKQGLYTLKLEQFMRMDVLPGLQAIGIKIIQVRQ